MTERDQTGASDLFSFSEYQDASSDKDIRKSYFQGRFGGIPQIFLSDYLISSSQDKNLKRTTEVTEKTQIN
ncbi:MAG: hypothetical protein IJU40_03185 [Desulfovibrionaceae bacterium]|nr:hypothetical protein [Desulfovibrionaceae bacterium]